MSFINPYFIFNGSCESAFTFYKSVFGGEFASFSRFKDVPQEEDSKEHQALSAYGERVMHVSLPIGKNILMGSDSNPDMGDVTIGQNVNISITVETKDEADRLFAALQKGGSVTVPMQDMFWGDYFGMVVDQFGVEWMISYNKDYQVPS